MRSKLISLLKQNSVLVNIVWIFMRVFLYLWGLFVPVQDKTMIFCSFGGRRFDDSPKAIYDEVCKRKEFDDWRLIWVFVNPDDFDIPRGDKIKIDTFYFFYALLYSHVWISNSGMDRGIELHRKKNIIVETWHGTPLKKILGDENKKSIGGGGIHNKRKKDNSTIRCAQSEYDKNLFVRLFNADENSILMCDLPRNDELLCYTDAQKEKIKNSLNIEKNKKVILYTPTYREYLVNEDHQTFLAPPIDLDMWRQKLGDDYVLLIRAHYAVVAELNIIDNDFVKDVSMYPSLNELYIISDMMISDYSSTFFDYSILNRPMLCFAYDLDEYIENRGLYLDLREVLPCEIFENEKEVVNAILNMDYEKSCHSTEVFHKKYAPFAGNASFTIVNEIKKRL